jgi:heme/copper-type cytochrome/quinol oxidase subunit 2
VQEVVLSRSVGAATIVFVLASAFASAAPARTEERVKRYDVVAMKFHFEPAVIEVDQGDHLVLSLRSADVKHGFNLKPYGIKTVVPKGGEAVTVELTADKAGTFSFSCSEYCGSRHSSMKGRLVVRPRAQ